MKCQEVSTVLEEYFDGELDEQHSRALAAHLGMCATCAASYGELEREQEFLLRYERDVEVTPQLWHSVAARIATENVELQTPPAPLGTRLHTWLASTFTVPRFSPALTAALVLVAIVLTVGVMKFTNKGAEAGQSIATIQTPQPAPSAANTNRSDAAPEPSASVEQSVPESIPVKNNPEKVRQNEKKKDAKDNKSLPLNNEPRIQLAKHEPSPDDLVRDAEAKYQKAIEILKRDVNKRLPTLDAATLARYDDTIKALDRTIAETRRAALGRGSNDPVAVQYMLTAYEKKVEVLREMARN